MPQTKGRSKRRTMGSSAGAALVAFMTLSLIHILPEVAKTYEGFYALLYEKPAIAADGSTVVEVYYDRIYSLMLFDLDGGYGVEPIYARYGVPTLPMGVP